MSIDRNCIEAPIAHQHKVIADLRHQLATRADENQRLEYELRRARADEAKLADHYQEVGALWHQACARAEAAEARIAELEAEPNGAQGGAA